MKKLIAIVASLSVIFTSACTSNQENGISYERDESNTTSSNKVDNQSSKDGELTPEYSEESSSKDDDVSTPEHYELSPLLSENLYDFQIQINNTVYQLPLSVEEFMSYGWDFGKYDNPDDKLNSYFDDLVWFDHEDGSSWDVSVINFSKSALPLLECYVGEIDCSMGATNGIDNTYVAIAGGIEYGISNETDIRSAYGEPTEVTEITSAKILTYALDLHSYVELWISSDTNTLTSIKIRNYSVPDDFIDVELQDEVPEFVTNYKEPQELGSNVLSQIIQLDEDLYTVPFPVKTALDNGWTLDEESRNQTIRGGGHVYINLEKGDYKIEHITVENPCDYEIDVIYGVVAKFYIDRIDKIPFKLSGNIELGMSISKLEQALSNTEFIKEDGVSDPRYSIVLSTYSDGNASSYISILTSDDAVSYISINLFGSI